MMSGSKQALRFGRGLYAKLLRRVMVMMMMMMTMVTMVMLVVFANVSTDVLTVFLQCAHTSA